MQPLCAVEPTEQSPFLGGELDLLEELNRRHLAAVKAEDPQLEGAGQGLVHAGRSHQVLEHALDEHRGARQAGVQTAICNHSFRGTGITTYLEKRELAHPKATRMDVVETMLERKTRMAELSDAFVSLPGGIGTLDELFEMLTWSRLQEHDKPSGLLNVDGFYDELISFCCKTQVEAGFITAEDAANLIHSDNLPDLLEKLAEAAQDGPSSLYRD